MADTRQRRLRDDEPLRWNVLLRVQAAAPLEQALLFLALQEHPEFKSGRDSTSGVSVQIRTFLQI